MVTMAVRSLIMNGGSEDVLMKIMGRWSWECCPVSVWLGLFLGGEVNVRARRDLSWSMSWCLSATIPTTPHSTSQLLRENGVPFYFNSLACNRLSRLISSTYWETQYRNVSSITMSPFHDHLQLPFRRLKDLSSSILSPPNSLSVHVSHSSKFFRHFKLWNSHHQFSVPEMPLSVCKTSRFKSSSSLQSRWS